MFGLTLPEFACFRFPNSLVYSSQVFVFCPVPCASLFILLFSASDASSQAHVRVHIQNTGQHVLTRGNQTMASEPCVVTDVT
jgi:hypothetical protein